MDRETSIFLGKILGEIYSLKRRQEKSTHTIPEAHIYALLNGFEGAIAEELEMIGNVSEQQVDATAEVLQSYFDDQGNLKEFKGFYDIENELSSRGIDRSQAIKILTYFYASDSYTSIIDKMDSSDSPAECRDFKLREYEI